MNPKLKRAIMLLLPPIVAEGLKRLMLRVRSGAHREWEVPADPEAAWNAHSGWFQETATEQHREGWPEFVRIRLSGRPIRRDGRQRYLGATAEF